MWIVYAFFKNVERHENIKNMVPFEKRRQLKLLILVFQNQIRKSLFCQKKLLLILKILLTRRKILFDIPARLIDQYLCLFCIHRDDVEKCT